MHTDDMILYKKWKPMSHYFSTDDYFFMSQALEEAKKAYQDGEVPVGAVLVHGKTIISAAHNQVEGMKDSTAHAEITCLQKGTAFFNDWRLLDTTLYVTLEPCSMCAGALLLARVKKVIWGAPDYRHGANGSWIDILGTHHPIHNIDHVGGLMEEEAKVLMQTFFKKQRIRKKNEQIYSGQIERAF